MADEIRPGNRNPRNLYRDPTAAGHFAVVVGDLDHAAEMSAWLADAARAHIAAGNPMPEPDPKPTSYELLDAAAERGHDAMFEGALPDGIERALWHKVVLAVLADPQLLPHWARAARVDADNWHRQCLALEEELQRTRKQRDLAVAHDRQPYPTAWAYEQVCRADREKRARIDDVLAWLEDADGMELTRVGIDAVRAKLQGDQLTEPDDDGFRCCIGPFADGRHAKYCRQRCQDCQGDPDGPARCRCRDDAGNPVCTCTENRCDYDDHDNPLTGDECIPCGQRLEGTPCLAIDEPSGEADRA